MPSVTVPGSHGRAIRLDAGETVRVVNTHGTQVVDFWALRADRPEIAMSMQHSRIAWNHLRPRPGDVMLDEERQVILTFVEDTSPGVHDTVIAACDPYPLSTTRRQAGPPFMLHQLRRGLGRAVDRSQQSGAGSVEPVHEHPVGSRGNITFEPTVSAPGDSVLFRAEVDTIVVASACPHRHGSHQRSRRWHPGRRRAGQLGSA